jgi:hypothetical protein
MPSAVHFENDELSNPELSRVANSFRRAFSYAMGVGKSEQMPSLSRELDLIVRTDGSEIRVTLFIVVSKDTPDEKFDTWFGRGVPDGYRRVDAPLIKSREIMDDGPVTVLTGSLIRY